jgi:hypothetical protein
VCEDGFYSVNGLCQACGSQRKVVVTICFAVAVVALVFVVLLYLFVRPGADIDEAADSLKDQLNDGVKPTAFNPNMLSMRNFLNNTVRPPGSCMHAPTRRLVRHLTLIKSFICNDSWRGTSRRS